MEYQALYRKYRPQTFADVVGQDHVTNTLAREIADNKVAHAYLFAGPRGTGKTTTARILAKSLNCHNRAASGEPCNECDSCRAVVQGSSFDVTELDAASHNSVDDIRDIKVSVTTVASVGGAKRIFILDEAHMLSKAAGNALLKTLEEPPEHVHFVLATTEPYKLLDTIRSRSQRFDFHPVAIDQLIDHLAGISESEGFTASREALALVARHARGSVRDSLSLLEQVAALGAGTVDGSGVNRALGLADRDVYLGLANAMAQADPRIALQLVSGLAAEGVDLRRFVAESIGFFRGVFLAHYAPDLAEVADESDDILADWRTVAEQLPPAEVIRAIDTLSDGLIRLREGREERLMTELTLLKLTRPEVATDVASVGMRINALEQRVSAIARQSKEPRPDADAGHHEPAPPPSAAVTPAPAPDKGPEDATDSDQQAVGSAPPEAPAGEVPVTDAPTPEAPVGETPPGERRHLEVVRDAPTPGELTLEAFEQIWPALVARVREELGSRRQALFREAKPGRVDGSTVVLEIPAHLTFHLEQLMSDDQVGAAVAERASDLLHADVSIRFESAGTQAPTHTEPEIFDKDQLVEADDSADDPVSLVEDILGGEIIDET
ncbi:MAG: DNA polymerase III subunit gamma/tau [Acidimicrobiia bacterium]|nr:DNA polymerase III subunit gamma/tau [Acidimicrobiia bacterium]